jgi:hypothetical protein
MVVRLLTDLSGPTVYVASGQTYVCDEATGQRLIAAGLAVPIEREAMAVVPSERAVPDRPRRRVSG